MAVRAASIQQHLTLAGTVGQVVGRAFLILVRLLFMALETLRQHLPRRATTAVQGLQVQVRTAAVAVERRLLVGMV